MRLIALFIPAIISLGIKYRKNREKKWEYFDFIYEYAISLVSQIKRMNEKDIHFLSFFVIFYQ